MSPLLQSATRLITPIMLLLSILLVLRGHNYPGGGFIGALVATAAIGLNVLAFGVKADFFERYTPRLAALGFLCLLLSFALPFVLGQPALTGLWVSFKLLGNSIKLGTPLLFDFGIYFMVVASLTWLIAELEDKKQ